MNRCAPHVSNMCFRNRKMQISKSIIILGLPLTMDADWMMGTLIFKKLLGIKLKRPKPSHRASSLAVTMAVFVQLR